VHSDQVFPTDSFGSDLITLRMLNEDDAPAIAIACNDVEIQKWLPLPTPYTIESARWFVNDHATKTQEAGTGIIFAIDHAGDFIGCIDVKRAEWINGECEIGYWTMPEHRGHGYMAQALDILSRWVLLSQGFTRTYVRVAVENIASQRVAEKAGFIREGIARQAGRVHSGRVDLVIYSKVTTDLVQEQ